MQIVFLKHQYRWMNEQKLEYLSKKDFVFFVETMQNLFDKQYIDHQQWENA
jgi:hypothetical protein